MVLTPSAMQDTTGANPPETVDPERDNSSKMPDVDESFQKLLNVVGKYDEEMVKGWRDDIDTLLVFAGLFSAMVTAFLIESYQKLEEDPADKTVTLLEQLVSLQQPNASQNAFSDSTPFQPSTSIIRINCFWFLSLILSLTSALFGLLCKQWIREHERDPPTQSPSEALALRQLRRDSFEKWGVPSFVAALPVLLEIALLLFLIGILDLLWSLRSPIPFGISLVAIVLTAGMYFVTTLLPALTIPKEQKRHIRNRRFERLSYQFICPYKSPQAWMLYHLVCSIGRLMSKVWLFRATMPSLLEHVASAHATDWSSFDLRVVRQFDQYVRDDLFNIKLYEIRAFEWAVRTFRDSPSMITHLQTILGTISPSVAISAVLDHWNVALWEDISSTDVGVAIRGASVLQLQQLYTQDFPPAPTVSTPGSMLHHSYGIRLLFFQQYWVSNSDRHVFPDQVPQEDLGALRKSTDLHFLIPFPAMDRLWTHGSSEIRNWSLGFLRMFEEAWESCSDCKDPESGEDVLRHKLERVAFVLALARHVNRTERESVLLTSRRGLGFIRFIHNEVIKQRLYWYPLVKTEWAKAVERVQEVGDLPEVYLVRLPGPSEQPPTLLATLPAIRYSVETASGEGYGGGRALARSGEMNDGEEVLDIETTGDLSAGPIIEDTSISSPMA
ncbi:hypothetical protein VNI00_008016 [Paramarasmius palmivorus]|uniref:DUF6535 domain-containing protein n=1 Tax=Paramarasmius palmivorus TaxID=297713 RepID=A0AAW0CXA3_9AGAR